MNVSSCGGDLDNNSCECVRSSSVLNECLWKPEVPYSQPLVVLIVLFYFVILLLAVAWNGLVIFVFVKNRLKLWQEPSSVFLFTLAVVDVLEAVLSLPFYITAFIAGGWIFGSTDVIREGMCVAVGFIFSVFLLATVHLIALISFDRFLYIVYPLKYTQWMNSFRALCLTGIVSIVPLILASTPLFGFGKFGYSPFLGVCLFRWEGEQAYVITVVAEVLIPIVATIVFTVWTYIHAKRYLRRRHMRQASYVASQGDISARNQKVNRALTRIFVLLLVSQAICFTPGIITAVIGFFVGFVNIPTAIFLIAFVVIISNAGINPIIQSLSRRQFRHYPYLLIRKLSCKSKSLESTITEHDMTEHTVAEGTIEECNIRERTIGERTIEERTIDDIKHENLSPVTTATEFNGRTKPCQAEHPDLRINVGRRYTIDPIGGTLV